MKEMNTLMEHHYHKMRSKRNILFRAFVINIVLVLAAWLFSMTPLFDGMMSGLFGYSAVDSEIYMLNLLGIWDVAGVVLFLVPALAVWWEMRAFGKYA
jgi:hypothetical protein